MRKEVLVSLLALTVFCALAFWTWRGFISVEEKKRTQEVTVSDHIPLLRQNLIFFPKPSEIRKPRRFVEDDSTEDNVTKDAESIELPPID